MDRPGRSVLPSTSALRSSELPGATDSSSRPSVVPIWRLTSALCSRPSASAAPLSAAPSPADAPDSARPVSSQASASACGSDGCENTRERIRSAVPYTSMPAMTSPASRTARMSSRGLSSGPANSSLPRRICRSCP